MSEELKCVLTITGKKGVDETNINLEFNPPIMKEGEEQWGDSGATIMVGLIMEALKEAKTKIIGTILNQAKIDNSYYRY